MELMDLLAGKHATVPRRLVVNSRKRSCRSTWCQAGDARTSGQYSPPSRSAFLRVCCVDMEGKDNAR